MPDVCEVDVAGRAVADLGSARGCAGARGRSGDRIRPFAVTEARQPCEAYHPLRQPFFGDTHVHTAYSLDASTQDTRNTPRDAYRFARGEPIGIQPYDDEGRPLRTVQLTRPLDFAAVTDHAELLGEVGICKTPGLPGTTRPSAGSTADTPASRSACSPPGR